MLIDSHAHLEMKEFDSDREEVIKRAGSEGVDFIVTVGTNLKLSLKAVALADQYENIYATVGVHPHDAAKTEKNTLEALKELAGAHRQKVVAYGEIGLDFFRDISPREKQLEIFGRQLELAGELNLPVIIHDREAHKQTLETVKASGIRRGVFHCFSGDYEMAKECLDLGFYISIPGVVTFDKAKTVQDVAQRLPLSSMLLETDAPYLTPVPHRGKRNEPSFIIHTAKKVAEIKKIPWEEVAQVTARNTMNLFGIKVSPVN
ncbi:MAG: hydrolase TatD [Deltaproteobacteria bacterium HGW-Deltaproteobacteria-13]|jgi:TatD DNase family protein|nr:MAG: hydrolase TatD [Deltaproteobacteria bacterium HGW-Deltaproteobacteria-13]